MTSNRLSRLGSAAFALLVVGAVAAFVFRYSGDSLVLSDEVDNPQAIVVLASHEWERLPVAAGLARQYPRAQVWLTEPEEETEHNCHECSERVSRLRDAGVSPERVTVLPQKVKNTYTEAKAARAFAAQARIERLVVVTSPYHGRRALATFRHLFQSTGVPTRIGLATARSRAIPARWWKRTYDREYVAYEWAGIVYYALRFGVPPTL